MLRCTSSVGRASRLGPWSVQLYWHGFESRLRNKVVGKAILAATSVIHGSKFADWEMLQKEVCGEKYLVLILFELDENLIEM